MKKIILIILLIPINVLISNPCIDRNNHSRLIEWYKKMQYCAFKEEMAFTETSNNQFKINEIGCIGLFQFGRLALIETGFSYIDSSNFIDKFPLDSQLVAFDRYIKINEVRLCKLIDKYQFKIVNGIFITKAGILAAAHLCGSGGVKRYFNNGYISKDINNSTIETYLKKFSKYKI